MNGVNLAWNFWGKVNRTSACWLWEAALSTRGYGRITIAGRQYQAHRLAYESLVGPIPEGRQVDHLCRVRRCVNPAHLEIVTGRENVLRGNTIVAQHAAKTHCPRGHEYSAENTRRWRGHRKCRTCENAREREHRKER